MASDFKSAFASARKAGKKEFTWNGKSYNTELKDTVRPKARGTTSKESGPMPRPKAVSADAGLGPSGATKSNFAQLKENIAASRADRNAARKERTQARIASKVAPKPRPTNESEGRAHLGRNRPLGKRKRGL
jgi:hypothetical protein